MAQPISQPPPACNGFRFPQTFGLYHASGSTSDYVIALDRSDSNPIYYVATHSGWSSQPSVVLHSAANEAAPPLATADFHGFGNTIDLSLYVGIPPGSKPQFQEMKGHGWPYVSRTFSAPVPSSGKLEQFEWRSSSSNEVQMLGAKSHGFKCVRLGTGEVVASYAYQDWSYRERARLAFIGDRNALGEAFEVLAVTAMAASYEKRRRQKKSNNAGAGAGAGAGASAAAM